MVRSIVSVMLLVMLAACAREGIQTEPQFTDWSYRTRDREHNRYDGYANAHIREEQWQTDPYWTQGEGFERREKALAKKLEREVEARENVKAAPVAKKAPVVHATPAPAAAPTPMKQRMPMPGKPVLPPEEAAVTAPVVHQAAPQSVQTESVRPVPRMMRKH